jgi:hypothetical protein
MVMQQAADFFQSTNLIGYLAASLVLATFCARSLATLRMVGIASNLAFIAYGYLDHITPVLLLHGLLLPVNIVRLTELRLGGAVNADLLHLMRQIAPQSCLAGMAGRIIARRVVHMRKATNRAGSIRSRRDRQGFLR